MIGVNSSCWWMTATTAKKVTRKCRERQRLLERTADRVLVGDSVDAVTTTITARPMSPTSATCSARPTTRPTAVTA